MKEIHNKDIRWKQRFINFKKAFGQLSRFVAKDDLNEMEEQGLIKAFEYTYELSWKTLQDLLKEKGYIGIIGPRPVVEQCYRDGYITNGKAWAQMHQSRNLTSHTYDEETTDEIVNEIKETYFDLLKDLLKRLEKKKNKTIIQYFDEWN